MNTTLRAAVHLGKKTMTHEFENCKELSLENNRTAFQGNRKAEQMSDRNWHKQKKTSKIKGRYRQADCRVELINIPLPRSMFSLILALIGERWETILLNPGRGKSKVFGQHLFQRIESNCWTTYGIRVEKFHRIHYNGNPQSDSTDDGRIAV